MSPTVDVTPMPTVAPAGNTATAAGGETPDAQLFASLLGAVMPTGDGELSAALFEQGTGDGAEPGEEGEEGTVDPAAMGWAALFAIPQLAPAVTAATVAVPSVGTPTAGEETEAITLGDGAADGDTPIAAAPDTTGEAVAVATPTDAATATDDEPVPTGADAGIVTDDVTDATDTAPARTGRAAAEAVPTVMPLAPAAAPVTTAATPDGTPTDPSAEAATAVGEQPTVNVSQHQAPLQRAEHAAAPTEVVAPRQPTPAVHQVMHAITPVLEGPDGSYQMRLELRPPELGRVEVTVELRDGTVHVALHAERPQAVAALSSAIDELRNALRSGGVNPGMVSVDQQSRQQQQPNSRSPRASQAATGVAGVGEVDDDSGEPTVAAGSGDRALDVRM